MFKDNLEVEINSIDLFDVGVALFLFLYLTYLHSLIPDFEGRCHYVFERKTKQLSIYTTQHITTTKSLD